jgi:hypothetical protein
MAELDESLTKLRALKATLEDHLRRIESAISDIEKAQRSLEGGNVSLLQNATLSLKTEPKAPLRVRGEWSPAEIAHAARDVLLERGRPMKRGELVRELAQRGVPLAGKDKNKNLGTVLWRNENIFVSLAKLGYWVRGVPIPGVYEPEN